MNAVHRFRMAAARHLGAVLTPEVAAAIEVEAFARKPMRLPQGGAGALSVDMQQRQEYLDVINAAFGTAHQLNRVQVLAVRRGETICAVVMYSRITSRSCELTIASSGARDWASRATLRVIFGYPLLRLELHRLTVVVHERNEASLELCERLGFRREGLIREAFEDDADGIVMGMLRRECRWIQGA